MKCTTFSEHDLTPEQVEEITELYFIKNRNPTKIRDGLSFSLPEGVSIMDILTCVDVRKRIESKIREGSKMVTREEHIASLKKIRDASMGDPKTLRVALQAEIAIGTASGLYDRQPEPEGETHNADPSNMSTQQLESILRKNGLLPSPVEAEFTDVGED